MCVAGLEPLMDLGKTIAELRAVVEQLNRTILRLEEMAAETHPTKEPKAGQGKKRGS